MTDHGDQLREAFETHEHLAPDPAAVYARVQELSRSYAWRRRGAQVAGASVLGAGLIAGGIAIPSILPEKVGDNVSVAPAFQPGAPAATPSVSPAPSPSPSETPTLEQLRWDAYFSAGYDYNDAVALSKIWRSDDSIGQIKAEAGRRLLAGDTLPIRATPNDPETEGPSADPQDAARLDAYFAAGYDWYDAEKLADIWNLDDPSQAKIDAGKKLLAGETLPIRP